VVGSSLTSLGTIALLTATQATTTSFYASGGVQLINASTTISNLMATFATSTNISVTNASSTNATTTHLSVSGIFNNTGSATSSFTGGIKTDLLNVISTTASSTFNNGINLNDGCFAFKGNCISTGGGSVTGTGAQNQVTYWTSGTNLSSSASFYFDPLRASLGLGTTTPYSALDIASSSAPQLLFTDISGGVNQKHFYASTTGGGLAFGILNDALSTLTERFVITNGGGIIANSSSSVANLSIANGTTTNATTTNLSVSGGLNLASGLSLTVNGVNTLSATALGSAVIGSSLTSVGDLTSGSLAAGFGSILINQGSSTITNLSVVNGTTTNATTTNLAVTGGINLNSGLSYAINGANVLSGTALGSAVVGSSLTSLGTIALLTATQATTTSFYASGGVQLINAS
ncbi:MAG: hypothetical protein AAB796_00275, partial [Patescibacteria group bacterium]